MPDEDMGTNSRPPLRHSHRWENPFHILDHFHFLDP
jgi:hypothetical protein